LADVEKHYQGRATEAEQSSPDFTFLPLHPSANLFGNVVVSVGVYVLVGKHTIRGIERTCPINRPSFSAGMSAYHPKATR
jgi:hypothetical protein